MERLTDRKIILVTRKTRLQDLIVRYNTVQQAKFVIEHSGSDFSDYQKEDIKYRQSVNECINILQKQGSLHLVDREFLPNYIFSKDDIVVAIGQDGLVANTLKYLDNQPLIGVNPDPKRWDGVLLPFVPKDLESIMVEVLQNQRRCERITLAQVDLSDGQKLYAVNDLFIGQKSHVSAKYTLQYNDYREQQSSSGIIVSTGLGSTGWFKSILAGASGVASSIVNQKVSFRQDEDFEWDSQFLYYTVREPYPSKWTKTNLVFGKIDDSHIFKTESQMSENGVIFSDGIESDYLEFNSGAVATVQVADKKGKLVV